MDLQKVSKAIGATIATLVVAYLAKNNIVIEGNDVSTVVEYVVAGLIGFVLTYVSPRNK